MEQAGQMVAAQVVRAQRMSRRADPQELVGDVGPVRVNVQDVLADERREDRQQGQQGDGHHGDLGQVVATQAAHRRGPQRFADVILFFLQIHRFGGGLCTHKLLPA